MSDKIRDVKPVFLRLSSQISPYADEQNRAVAFALMPAMSADNDDSITDIVVDSALDGIRLGSETNRPIPLLDDFGTFAGLTHPTGLALGADDRIFVTDTLGNRLLAYSPLPGGFKPMWKHTTTSQASSEPSPYELNAPRGVAISHDGDIVVADSGNSRVIVYAFPSMAVRHIIHIKDSQPYDLAYDSLGNLYVADVANRRIWSYNRMWQRDVDYLGGAGYLTPRHLAMSFDNQLFVADAQHDHIIMLDSKGRVIENIDEVEALFAASFPRPIQLRDNRLLVLPQDAKPNCPPIELVNVVVDRRGYLVLDGTNTQIPILPRARTVLFPRRGRFYTQALDSMIYDCTWHRIVLDLDIPDASSITIRTLTAPNLLDNRRVLNTSLERWSQPLVLSSTTPPEILIQSGKGRYLWLRIDLAGNGQNTPIIHQMDIYAPRQSSFQYLPSVFHDDVESAQFLDRFLSYFDVIYDEIATVIENFAAYLDPAGVPSGEFLTWLGSWLDLEFLAAWDDEIRRNFIKEAISLYRQRGTVQGMRRLIELYTGVKPVIVEHFRLVAYDGSTPGWVDNTLFIAGVRLPSRSQDEAKHRFTVIVPRHIIRDDASKLTLMKMIDAQKPAHTFYDLLSFKPGLRIGCQSMIGVDTLIGDYPEGSLGTLILGQESQLDTRDKRPNLGNSRLQD